MTNSRAVRIIAAVAVAAVLAAACGSDTEPSVAPSVAEGILPDDHPDTPPTETTVPDDHPDTPPTETTVPDDHPDTPPTEPYDGICAELFGPLIDAAPDDVVVLITQASLDCVGKLEWVSHPAVQIAASRETNVLAAAEAVRSFVESDGPQSESADKLFLYLIMAADINLWCRTLGYCEGDEWEGKEPYPTAPGSKVYSAFKDALDAWVERGGASTDRAERLSEVEWLVNGLGVQAAYFPIIVEWIKAWDEDAAAEDDKQRVMLSLLEIIYWGHRNEWMADAYGEDSMLLQTFSNFVLDERWLGSESQWIMERLTVEIARFSKYVDTTNFEAMLPTVLTVLDKYDTPEGEAILLRMIAELDYIYPDDCARYGLCDWYEGDGFAANFRHRLLPHQIECPPTAYGGTVALYAQRLEVEDLELVCAQLRDHAEWFQEICGTGCEPVAGDVNTRLEAYVFEDSKSCLDYESAALGAYPDACSGIYFEGDPEDPANVARMVLTEYESTEGPQPPIWNLEHEYAHYLDGRFNMHGGFRDDPSTQWWAEGFAEYLATEVTERLPPPRYSEFTLTDIMLHSGSIPTSYDDRHHAVRFLMEHDRGFIDELLALTRQGRYEEYRSLMETQGPGLEAAWQAWLASGL